MKIHIRSFQEDDFPTYQSWFEDPCLNKALGPMDEEWLEYVMKEEDGHEYAFFQGSELVAVVGVAYGNEYVRYHTITDIAIKPALRGQGLGPKVLAILLDYYEHEHMRWQAFVDEKNTVAIRFMKKLGWTESGTRDGMICFKE